MTVALAKELSRSCPDCNTLNRGQSQVCYNCGFTFIELEKVDRYRKDMKRDVKKITSEQMADLLNRTNDLYGKLRELNHKDPDLFSDWGKRIYLLINIFIDGMEGNNSIASSDFLKYLTCVLRSFLKPVDSIWDFLLFKKYEIEILKFSIIWFDRNDEIEKYLNIKGEQTVLY